MSGERNTLPFSIHRISSSLGQRIGLNNTYSVSVDCDTPAHYAYAFAPKEHQEIKQDDSWLGMLESLTEVFKSLNIRATFFCIANQLENPSVRKSFSDIVAEGHEIGNHTWSHPRMDQLSESARQAEILDGHAAIVTHLGVTPVGYRAPNYYTTPESLSMLSDMGYLFDASAYRSRLTRLAYKIFTGGFEKKSQSLYPDFHFRYPATQPSIMQFETGKCMVEWPLPTPLGLAYLGTLHSITPSLLFLAQTAFIKSTGRHTHYALHIIEAAKEIERAKWPWLPLFSRKYHLGQRDSFQWLKTRLSVVVKNAQTTTLTTLSGKILKDRQNKGI